MSYERTSATLGGQYRKFFGASVAAAILLQVTIVTDTIIVGQLLGPVAMSGVRVASPIVNILNVLGMLVAVGGSTVAAIAIGRRDGDAANRAFTLSIVCGIVLGLVFAVAVVPFADVLAQLISSEPSSEEGEGALRIVLADDGNPFDPTNAIIAEKEFDDLDSGGMGIGLVRQLASGLHYRREAERNILVIDMAPGESQ